jgi:2-C-methyl-D-erythritol 4-phosphate cytidylyltransferase
VGEVVAAAGRGERMGGPVLKQFQPVAGVPLLLHALRPFLSHPDVADVIAVLPAELAAAPPEWLAGLLGERLRAVAGGATRMDSVEAGLRALPAECRIVLVHDGARPFPEPAVIDAVIGHARRGAGAIAAIPVADTLKEADPVGGGPSRVSRTISRAGLWRAQTPQGFPRTLLEAAFASARAAGRNGTDEAALVEEAGGEVVLVPDSPTNLKVTGPGDLRLAEAIAVTRR